MPLLCLSKGGAIIYNGDPITLFYGEELLTQAHLERPWVLEMVLALQKKKLSQENIQMPRSKKI